MAFLALAVGASSSGHASGVGGLVAPIESKDRDRRPIPPAKARRTNTTLAVVGGRPVTSTEFDRSFAATRKSIDDAFAERRARLELERTRALEAAYHGGLEKFVDDQVLAREAQATGKSTLALYGEVRPDPVTEDEIRAFYEDHRAMVGGQDFAAVRAQIRNYLEDQSADRANRRFLDSLRTKYGAAVLREPARATVAATGPSRGAAAAPVTLVEFGDFQCPYCAQFAPVLRQVLERYPDRVRLVYRNLPLEGIHPDARRLADAAFCAGEQNRFWEIHDALFAAAGAVPDDAVAELVTRDGGDGAAFKACIESGRSRAAIAADVEHARRLGVDTTPALFVNGRMLSGLVSYDTVARLVDDEIARDTRRRSTGDAATGSRGR